MASILAIFLTIIVLGWLVFSPAFVLWSYFQPAKLSKFAERQEHTVFALYVGGFISFSIVLSLGFQKLFVWIPSRWGSFDEAGRFVSFGSELAYLLAFFVAVFVTHLFCQAVGNRTLSEKLVQAEEALAAARRAASSAEQDAAISQREIKTIMNNLAKSGLLKAYEKYEAASNAEMDRLIESQLRQLDAGD